MDPRSSKMILVTRRKPIEPKKGRKMRKTVISLAIAVTGLSLAFTAQAQDALNGVWKVEEMTIEDAENPGPFTDLPPSLYIFTDGYYSIMSILGDGSRPDFQPGDDVSDEDTIAAYNTFLANSGSYEVSGSTITFNIMIARVPGVVGATGPGVMAEYSLDGDTLTMTQAQLGGAGNVIHRELVRLE